MKPLLSRKFSTPILGAVVTLWLGIAQALSQDATTETIIKEGKANNRVMEHSEYLCNKIGPRLTGSDKLMRASEWAVAQFKKFGCAKVYLEEYGTIAVGFNRGHQIGKALIGGKSSTLTCTTLAWSAGTNRPVTARAVIAPTNEADLHREKLKGAWVLLATVPDNQTQLNRLIAAIHAAGAAGVVRASREDLMRMSGNYRITWENRPTRPEIFVMNSQFAKLVSAVKAGQDVQLTFDMRNEFKKGPIKLYNVIAEIPGTEKPDECVIVGGHIDSWDLASGATDNSTGVATTMEAARILCAVGAKPKRTIRFILWSGEEQGLLGSIGWVRKHKAELPKISAVFVHDWGTNYISGLAATPALMPPLEKVFAPLITLDPQMKFTLRETATIPRAPSDNMPYLSAQVPAFLWSQSGRVNYSFAHHTQHDHYDRIVPEYQKHSALVVALAAWGVANLDKQLPR